MTLRGSPTPPGYRRETTIPSVKVSNSVKITYGQAELDGQLAATIATKTSEIAALNVTISGLQQDITTKTAELAVANQSLTALQAQYDVSTADLVAAEAEVASLTGDLATANAALSQAQSDIDTANATIADLEDQLANAGSGPSGLGIGDGYLEDLTSNAWTKEGVLSFVESYSYDAETKIHTVTLPTRAYDFNTDTIWTGGAYYSNERWWVPLKFKDGTPVMIGDAFSFTMAVDYFQVDGNISNWTMCLGTFQNSLDSFLKYSYNENKYIYGMAVTKGTSTGMGSGAGNSQTSNIAASDLLSGICTYAFPKASPDDRAVASTRPTHSIQWSNLSEVTNVGATGGYVRNSTADQSPTVTQQHLFFTFAPLGSLSTVGGTVSFRMSYSIGKL